MKKKLIELTKKHPVKVFWIISLLLAIAVAPIAITVFMSYPDFSKDINAVTDGKGYNTNIVYSLPIALKVSGGLWFAVMMLLMPFTATMAGVFTSLIENGKKGLKELFSRFRFWAPEVGKKEGMKIWFQAILVMVLLNLSMSIARNYISGVESADFFALQTQYSLGEFILIFITCLFFDGGGLMEEIGWRGFALPRLQMKFTPLQSSIILGIIWSLWHIPIKMNVTPFSYFITFYFAYTISCIYISILITYFFNRLGGSILIGIAIHGLFNDSTGLKYLFNPEGQEFNDFNHIGISLMMWAPIIIFLLYKEGPQLGLRVKKEV